MPVLSENAKRQTDSSRLSELQHLSEIDVNTIDELSKIDNSIAGLSNVTEFGVGGLSKMQSGCNKTTDAKHFICDTIGNHTAYELLWKYVEESYNDDISAILFIKVRDIMKKQEVPTHKLN